MPAESLLTSPYHKISLSSQRIVRPNITAMKYILFSLITLSLFSFRKSLNADDLPVSNQDSTKHTTDGMITEWLPGQFHPDDDTTVFMAAVSDQQNLYVALNIPDFSMQSKLMRNGMKLFIDLKEKKKESHGIEFPIAGEVNAFIKQTLPPQQPAQGGDAPKQTQPDKKKLRSAMALAMVSLKIFGFPTDSKEGQGLMVPGSAQVAFKWDAQDVMHIEYAIPLKLIGLSAHEKRSIDVGWQINAFERSQGEGSGQMGHNGHSGQGGHMQGMNESGSVGFNGMPGRAQRRMSMADMAREQSFWMKFTQE